MPPLIPPQQIDILFDIFCLTSSPKLILLSMSNRNHRYINLPSFFDVNLLGWDGRIIFS